MMKLKVSLSEASGRLLRRKIDNEVKLEDKRRRPRKKRFIRRGRLASSTRAVSRFSTFSSKRSNGEMFDVSSASEAASTSASTAEASIVSNDTTISSTVISIAERVIVEKQYHGGNDCVEEELVGFDSFFSRLLDLIQCFPHNPPNGPLTTGQDIGSFDDNIMQIECILRETVEEEPDQSDSATPQMKNTLDVSSKDINMLLPRSKWMQEPLLLVATPGSGCQILRVRRVLDPSYFESPTSLHEAEQELDILGESQVQLPINNGKEQPFHSWVIDFESKLFAGTALFRIRGSKGRSQTSSEMPKSSGGKQNNHDYFANQNRKFQMVIRGKFKPNVVMTDCVSGLLLDHHLTTSKSAPMDCMDSLAFSGEAIPNETAAVSKNKGKRQRGFKRTSSRSTDDSLPPKWALRAAVKVASVFSPRMDADLDCPHPRILSPLCSTAQTVTVSRKKTGERVSAPLDGKHVEPCPNSDASLMHDFKNPTTKKRDSSATNYVQQRKRAFDAAYDDRVEPVARNPGQVAAPPCFDPDAEYTFEFLQHLLDYNDLTLDLGRVLGNVKLGGALRGQPVRFISAAVKHEHTVAAEPRLSMESMNCLWSFDLWHKSLLL